MAASGFNAVRIPHTMPPRALLDIAAQHGLRVMVGLSAEQYVGYLADRDKAPDIDTIFRTRVRQLAGHPALLCYSLGNEISTSMVRWLGRRTVEQYLERLYRIVKAEDPEGLVTYVNYPSTEYLHLPFLDFVQLQRLPGDPRNASRAYLARLQNLAGESPAPHERAGARQHSGTANSSRRVRSAWQIRTTFAAGCSGAFVFSWTDEWYRGGSTSTTGRSVSPIEKRRPKLALARGTARLRRRPVSVDGAMAAQSSVVVCVYNGEHTIQDCCDGLLELDYPDHEVIVVDDGSRDRTAKSYPRTASD